MSCRVCGAIDQIAKNVALLLDKAANTLLLGDPNETLSQRTARAARAGERWAQAACRILGWVSPGHCEWSLTPGTIGAEVWHWSHPADAPATMETLVPTQGEQ